MGKTSEHELNEQIHHYTSATGLHGILGNSCFHATHYRFLNDPHELRHARQAVKDLFHEAYKELHQEGKITLNPSLYVSTVTEVDTERLIRNSAVEIAVSILDTYLEKSTAFIVSFSQHDSEFTAKNGILSQWRNYGVDGGYAIGLLTSRIADVLKNEISSYQFLDTRLIEVFYGPMKWDNDVVESVKNVILQRVQGKIDNSFGSDFHNITDLVRDWCLRNKSVAFSDENEIRALFTTYDGSISEPDETDLPEKLIQFRPRQGAIVPFIEIRGSERLLPISEIIVGPHPNQERRAEAVELFLKSIGYKNIPIKLSGIEYTSYF